MNRCAFFQLIPLLFLFHCNPAGSQNFVDTANRWNVLSQVNFGGYDTEIFTLSGDSTVDGKTYAKVWYSLDSAMSWKTLAGLVRQEGNKVWYIHPYYEPVSEGLLYDFDLEAGDTAQIISFWMPEPREYVCVSVDTTSTSGIMRKCWHFGYPCDEWLEGIGSLQGPFYSGASGFVFDLYFSLTCFHRNDTLQYMDPWATKCYYTNVGLSQPVANPDLVVSPVPARNGQMIRVESLREPIRRVEILQACGRCEYVQDVAPAATDMLPAQGLTPGIYFLRIVTANHRISFNKILLQ